jgi:hypothetical protein
VPGTRVQVASICDSVQGYNAGAVTAALVLWKYVTVSFGRIKGVKAYAGTAGTGGGNTVLDITINGTSIWSVAGNKPTLAATSTGEFANSDPDVGAFRPGDRVSMLVSSISTTGHADLYFTAAVTGD